MSRKKRKVKSSDTAAFERAAKGAGASEKLSPEALERLGRLREESDARAAAKREKAHKRSRLLDKKQEIRDQIIAKVGTSRVTRARRTGNAEDDKDIVWVTIGGKHIPLKPKDKK